MNVCRVRLNVERVRVVIDFLDSLYYLEKGTGKKEARRQRDADAGALWLLKL